MFLREGSQRGLTAVCCAALSTLVVVQSASAGGGVKGVGVGVELPREVLPWRRDIERSASDLLSSARQTAEFGSPVAAERQFEDLLQKFPRTHAATEGARDLAALKAERIGTGRRALGNPPQSPITTPLNPVAGWQTSVTPDPANLAEALIEAAGDRVFFDEGSVTLTARAQAVLKKQALWLKAKPQVHVRVVGHADDQGTLESNLRLSHDRAAAVRQYLIKLGVAAPRLRVFSHGKAQPIAICSVRTCAAQNRRVVTEIPVTQQAAASPN